MSIERLMLVNIFGGISLLNTVIDKICIQGDFQPENVLEIIKSSKGFFPFDSTNPSAATLKRANALLGKLNISPEYEDFSDGEYDDGSILNAKLSTYEHQLDDYFLSLDKCRAEIAENEHVLKQIAPILNTDMQLDSLFHLDYLKFRFGVMPKNMFDILESYTTEKNNFIYVPSSIDKNYVWLMYFVSRPLEARIDQLFTSLAFERVRISDRAHGNPQQAYEEITTAQKLLHEQQEHIERDIETFTQENTKAILKLYSKLKHDNDCYEIRRNAAHSDNNFYLIGWVPKRKCADIQKVADGLSGVSCVFEEPDNGEVLPPAPTKLRNRGLLKPFEEFVRMYGTPVYNEFDPTPLVAITYTIIFGLMFGDIGQGLILMLAGSALWFFKKINLGRIMAICGISSTACGFLYGSVFGYEQFMKGFRPLESNNDFNISLIVSIGIGIVLLIFSMCINISNGVKQKDIGKIFFSSNGVAGLIFYVSVIAGVVELFLFKNNIFSPLYLIFLIALPLITMFLKEPLTEFFEKKHHQDSGHKTSKVEFFIQNFFELFEVVLSYVTNTISFVRIGAFALNHAGLMMFVFILARMSGKGDNLFVVIVGNAFVILLEGLIVGIQVLRIQFYELFSHFYSGEGKPFEPITIKYDNN